MLTVTMIRGIVITFGPLSIPSRTLMPDNSHPECTTKIFMLISGNMYQGLLDRCHNVVGTVHDTALYRCIILHTTEYKQSFQTIMY